MEKCENCMFAEIDGLYVNCTKGTKCECEEQEKEK
jgi:hypothetical protein